MFTKLPELVEEALLALFNPETAQSSDQILLQKEKRHELFYMKIMEYALDKMVLQIHVVK